MVQRVLRLMMAMVFAMPIMSFAADTQVDSLIKKLVDKGILTQDEATGLKGEIATDEKNLRETNMKRDMPEWIQSTKLTGDFRARIQSERREDATNGPQGDRLRSRLRARLNVETKPNDKTKVVIGIASDGGTFNDGKNNARSNNYTDSSYGGSTANPFSKPNIVLNKAYGQYMPTDEWTLTAGKMDNPIWEPMEFLWDADITPEGGAVQYKHQLTPEISLFGMGAMFALNEFNPSSSDPFMYVGQAGALYKPNDKIDAKGVFTYTGYGNIKTGFNGGNKNNTLGNSAPIASQGEGPTALKYDYSAPMGSAEIGFNDPFGEALPIYIPRIGLFGEYTENPNAEKSNVAWMSGAYVGNSKISGFGTWKATAAYKVLEKDAWLDILPDSDFYSGNTGVAGTEGILEVGLAKNMSFVVDYYHARRIGSGIAKAPEHVIQYDINWKF